MKQSLVSSRIRANSITFLVLVGTLFCSPIGWVLILTLQVASLPESYYPVVHFLHALSFLLPSVWLGLCLSTPVFSILPLASQKYHQYRRFVPVSLAAWIISWSSLPLRPSSSQLRRAGLIRITQQAKPLINAVEAYRVQNGQYPKQLNDLVPAFLRKIPYTGAVGYPNFEYRAATGKSLFKSYEVRVRTPVGGINWDVFVYWPEKNYPLRMYGGGVERIGNWAYVHE